MHSIKLFTLLFVFISVIFSVNAEKFVPAKPETVTEAFKNGWEIYVFKPSKYNKQIQCMGKFKFSTFPTGTVMKGTMIDGKLYLMDQAGNMYQPSSGNHFDLKETVTSPEPYKKSLESRLASTQKSVDDLNNKYQGYTNKLKELEKQWEALKRVRLPKDTTQRDLFRQRQKSLRNEIKKYEKLVKKMKKDLKEKEAILKDVKKESEIFTQAYAELQKSARNKTPATAQ